MEGIEISLALFYSAILLILFFLIPLYWILKKRNIYNISLLKIFASSIVIAIAAAILGLLLAIPTDLGRYFMYNAIVFITWSLFFVLGSLLFSHLVLEETWIKNIRKYLLGITRPEIDLYQLLVTQKHYKYILSGITIFSMLLFIERFGINLMLDLKKPPIEYTEQLEHEDKAPIHDHFIQDTSSALYSDRADDLTNTKNTSEVENNANETEETIVSDVLNEIIALKKNLDFKTLQKTLTVLRENDSYNQVTRDYIETEYILNRKNLNALKKGGPIELLHKYKVQNNDNLYSIAQKFSTTQAAISSINPIEGHLLVDQILYVPLKTQAFKHTIKNGDTLYLIAKKYTIWISQIEQLNNSTSDHIVIGKQLIVFRGKK